MKKALILVMFFIAASTTLFAGKLDSIVVNYKGVDYTIKIGDQLHLGYGKNPYGSFQYIERGSPPQPMEKNGGGKTSEVYQIWYYKMGDILKVMIKIKGVGQYAVYIHQAIDIGEIVGLNDITFPRD